jgi:3'(2'), 5'-bisphosphate nucleotidase
MALFDLTQRVEIAEAMTALAAATAQTILSHGRTEAMRIKPDGSPVTAADEAADALIGEGLAGLKLGLPVISEERVDREHPRIAGSDFIFVDPLDGTREFIAGRGEFTVNIGLVCDGAPIAGVIAAPAHGLIWRGVVGRGAERLEFSADRISPPQRIHARMRQPGELIVAVSRSHLDAQTQAYLDRLPHSGRLACGSSIKFCRLAEGSADHYPRLSPTRDWDVAAGHAILAAAGGSVTDPAGAALAYGTAELRIPAFLAWGDPPPTSRAREGT